jgi:hypothetical protein
MSAKQASAVVRRSIFATHTTLRYPPSTAFAGGEEELKHIFLAGHSVFEVFKCLRVVVDFNNAVERGEPLEVRV